MVSSASDGRRSIVLGLVALVVLAGCVSVGPTAPASPEPEPTGVSGSTATPAATTSAGAETGTATGTPVPSTAPRVTVEVVDVVDGDTVKVRFPNGTRETVRLLGVDTPEVHAETTPDEFEGVPSTAEGRTCLRRAGESASDHAASALAGREVGLGFDEREGRRGYYGRLLAYVYVDGRQFNHALVAEGYARVYDSRFVERERYEAAERAARAAGRGVWSCATASDRTTAEPTGDAGTATVAVVSIHADAAGDDNENLADEYVVLQNVGDEPVDLAGWRLRDEADHTFRFPAGTVLEPGATVTVRTGAGTDEPGVRYWGRERAVWNNGGDTVILEDPSGTVVAERSY
jgi:micrococcal nuclease